MNQIRFDDQNRKRHNAAADHQPNRKWVVSGQDREDSAEKRLGTENQRNACWRQAFLRDHLNQIAKPRIEQSQKDDGAQ